MAGEKAARTPRFVMTVNGLTSLDKDAPTRARILAGLKSYVTNLPVTTMPAAKMIAS